eukprot:579002-Rhodomonas_salina.1
MHPEHTKSKDPISCLQKEEWITRCTNIKASACTITGELPSQHRALSQNIGAPVPRQRILVYDRAFHPFCASTDAF